MIYYHGTTLDAAQKIAKQGLKPVKSRKFRIARKRYGIFGLYSYIDRSSMTKIDRPSTVYFTEATDVAETYAKFRAQYAQAKKGDKIVMHPPKSAPADWGDIDFFKQTVKVVPDAKPAIVKLDLPEDIVMRTKEDTQGSWRSYEYQGSIPAQYVVGIEAL